MSQDEIIDMAQECRLIGMRPHLDGIYSEALVAFAKLLAEKERKACAKIARLFHNPNYGDFLTKNSTESSRNHVVLEIEAAILSRGQND